MKIKEQLKLFHGNRTVAKNWMFLFTKSSSWILVEVRGWIVLAAAANKSVVFISSNAGQWVTWQSSLLRFMKFVIAKDVTWNCLNFKHRYYFLSYETFLAKCFASFCICRISYVEAMVISGFMLVIFFLFRSHNFTW